MRPCKGGISSYNKDTSERHQDIYVYILGILCCVCAMFQVEF